MPEITLLNKIFYHNSLRTWLAALISAAAVWIVLLAVRKFMAGRFFAFTKKTKNTLDDLVVQLVKQTKWWFMVVVALYSGALMLALPAKTAEIISAITIVIILLQGGIWSNAILDYLVDKGVGKGEKTAAISTMVFIGRLVIWTAFFLLILDNIPGVDIGSLIAGFGVAGIAVALAVQTILSDLFAALSIILDKPFIEGDFVVVDDFSGTVEKIGLKSTRIRSLSGELLVFGNTDLLSSRIRNYKHMKRRRVVFTIGVVYETPPEKLEKIPEILKQIINAQEYASFDRAHFKSYGDSALNYEIVYYMDSPDYQVYMDTQQDINLALFRQFTEEGIEFAYPTQTIFLANHGTESKES